MIHFRAQYKVLVLTYEGLHGLGTMYLQGHPLLNQPTHGPKSPAHDILLLLSNLEGATRDWTFFGGGLFALGILCIGKLVQHLCSYPFGTRQSPFPLFQA